MLRLPKLAPALIPILALLTLLALPWFHAPALAAPGGGRCGVRHEIVDKLSKTFKESPAALGVVNKDAVIEVFVSETGTWTIIATGSDGRSCVLSSGDGWESTTFAIGKGA